ncbi:hypothetical protein Sjap_000031 [Stephania japonica]|uniref:Uncharacterized protein n=1 Tax=Stephania japonica TaxID=461633 RepID=A0AAP0KH88_9MAGN
MGDRTDLWRSSGVRDPPPDAPSDVAAQARELRSWTRESIVTRTEDGRDIGYSRGRAHERLPSPSTSGIAPRQDVSPATPQATPPVTTTSTVPAPPITAVVPAQIAVESRVHDDIDSRLTAEARWTREYEKYKPKKFSGGSSVDEADLYIRSHEKVQKLLKIEDSRKPGLAAFSLTGDAEMWWENLVSTHGEPTTG